MRRRTLPKIFTSGIYLSASFVALAAVLTTSVQSQAKSTCSASDYELVGNNNRLRLKQTSTGVCFEDKSKEEQIKAQLSRGNPAAPAASRAPAPRATARGAARPAAATKPAAAPAAAANQPPAAAAAKPAAVPAEADAKPAAPAADLSLTTGGVAPRSNTPQDERQGLVDYAKERSCEALRDKVASADQELSKACRGIGKQAECYAKAEACTAGDERTKEEFQIDQEEGEYKLMGMLGKDILKGSAQCTELFKNTCPLLAAEKSAHNREVADKALKRRESLEDKVQEMQESIEKKTKELTEKMEEAQKDLEKADEQISALDESWSQLLDKTKVDTSSELFKASKAIADSDENQIQRNQLLTSINNKITQKQNQIRQQCVDEKDAYIKAKRASVAKAKSGLNGISSGTKRINDGANYKYRECLRVAQMREIDPMMADLSSAQNEDKTRATKEKQSRAEFLSQIQNDQELTRQRLTKAFEKYQRDSEKLKTNQAKAQQKLIQAQMQMQPGGPLTVLQQKLEQKSKELEEAKKNETLAETRAQCGESVQGKLTGRKDDQSVGDIPEAYGNLSSACLDLISNSSCNSVVVKDGRNGRDGKAVEPAVEVTGRCAFVSRTAEFQSQLKAKYGGGSTPVLKAQTNSSKR